MEIVTVVRLAHADSKFSIFKFSKNGRGQFYFMKSDMDPQQQELRNIYQMLNKENKLLDETETESYSYAETMHYCRQ